MRNASLAFGFFNSEYEFRGAMCFTYLEALGNVL